MSTLRTLLLALPASALLGVLPLAASTRIDDPVAFVREVYRRLQNPADSGGIPDDIYTPRLKKLFEENEEKEKKAPDDGVGCLDFDYWTTGQDEPELANVEVTGGTATGDRKVVVAKFLNYRIPQEIHFEFRRIDGRWLLDDVSSLKDIPWTLSKILKCDY